MFQGIPTRRHVKGLALLQPSSRQNIVIFIIICSPVPSLSSLSSLSRYSTSSSSCVLPHYLYINTLGVCWTVNEESESKKSQLCKMHQGEYILELHIIDNQQCTDWHRKHMQDMQKSTNLLHRAFCLHGRRSSDGHMTTIISGCFDLIMFVALVPLPLFFC